MAQNGKLCVICCYSYYAPTPKNISYNIRHHLTRFCKELQLEQVDQGDPPDPLESGSTGIKALNAFFNGLEAFFALSICPHCVALISSAMDVKDKAALLEQRVRQLQLKLLQELKLLERDIANFHMQMRRIEEVVETGDVTCLRDYMSECNLPPADDLKYSSVVLNFRESVLHAMDDLQQYREKLHDKVSCAAPFLTPKPKNPVNIKDEIPESLTRDYDFDIEFAQECTDESEEQEANISMGDMGETEDYDEVDGSRGGDVDETMNYGNEYAEGYTDDDESMPEGEDSITYPPPSKPAFSNRETIILVQGSDTGVPYTPYTPPAPQIRKRPQLPQAKNKPPGVATAYFSWMEFQTVVINGKRKLICDVCDRPMANKQAVLNHKWTHLNEEETAEAVAQGGIDPRVRFLQYKAEGRFAVPCPICGRVCSQSSVLKLHMRIHQKVHMMCPKCGKKFETEDNICKHQAESCFVGEEPRFQCPYCEDVFKAVTRLKDHVENAHTIENPFVCAVCNQGFATAPELKTHWKIHKTLEGGIGGGGGGSGSKRKIQIEETVSVSVLNRTN